MILVSTIRFSGMPDLVVLSEITLDVALWVKSKMAAFCSRSNRGRFMFKVSIMGFSGMPDIVVLSENILDIAL